MNPFTSFHELNIPAPLLMSLGKMNFTNPTPVQQAAIPAALEGKDILGTAQTGTGKTGAFSIPLLAALENDRSKCALVLVPTREIAAQVFQVLREMSRGLNFYGVLLIGGESFNRQADDMYRGGVDFIVATPGRLNDHLMEKTVDLSAMEFLVLDEVDRMLDMGFLPQIKRIMAHVPNQRQTLLFSATLPNEIQGLAASFLENPVRVQIGSVTESAPEVEETTIRTTMAQKNTVVLQELAKRQGRILIFTRTKSRADRLAMLIERENYPVVNLHGGRTQGQRKQALDRFRKGSHRIMVATDLAGRGIDVNDIEHVINYDMPETREDYIHRIGRTARFGKKGCAINLVTDLDGDAEQTISGVKRPARVVYRSRRSRSRR